MKWSIWNQLKVEIIPFLEMKTIPSVFFVLNSFGRNKVKYRIHPQFKENVLKLESTESRSEVIKTSVYLSEDEVVYDAESKLTIDKGKISVVNNDIS